MFEPIADVARARGPSSVLARSLLQAVCPEGRTATAVQPSRFAWECVGIEIPAEWEAAADRTVVPIPRPERQRRTQPPRDGLQQRPGGEVRQRPHQCRRHPRRGCQHLQVLRVPDDGLPDKLLGVEAVAAQRIEHVLRAGIWKQRLGQLLEQTADRGRYRQVEAIDQRDAGRQPRSHEVSRQPLLASVDLGRIGQPGQRIRQAWAAVEASSSALRVRLRHAEV